MELVSGLATAGLVLAALIAIVWKFGKLRPNGRLLHFAGPKESRPLQSPERIRLTPHHSVHMVNAGGKTLVVGCHAAGMVLLAELSAAEMAESGRKAA